MPDVEKIARELASQMSGFVRTTNDNYAEYAGYDEDAAAAAISNALAQARAPLATANLRLVAALRDVRGEIIAFIESDANSVLRKEAPLRIKEKVNDALCAALTGTEEK